MEVKKWKEDDFCVMTSLSFLYLFGFLFIFILGIIIVNPSKIDISFSNIPDLLFKVILYGSFFTILGMVFNYFLLKSFKIAKEILFTLIDGNKKKIVFCFVYGSVFVYFVLLVMFLIDLFQKTIEIINKQIENIS